MVKPVVPTNLACAWCKGVGICPVGDPTWDDGKGEGATHGGCWYQVYEHPNCGAPDKNFKRWTYRIAYGPVPIGSDQEYPKEDK